MREIFKKFFKKKFKLFSRIWCIVFKWKIRCMTIVKGIGIMKKRCKMIIALLSAAMVLTACAKNTSDTDSNKANDTKTQDTSKDAAQDDTETEKTKEYQAKLDMIEPSAYGDASGLSLEEGAYISIIGKGTNDDFWVQVKKGAEQAGKDINEQLGYKGKKAVKVVYSGPSDKDNVDEQVNILDEELSRYPAALAISIADAKACEVQFDQAGWNGTPIVTFDWYSSPSDQHTAILSGIIFPVLSVPV